MNRSAFLKTSIEVLKYDKRFKEISGREELIRLLGRAKINFVPQYAYSSNGRSGQRWEDIELRFPVPLLDKANEFENELEKIVDYVYEDSDDYAFRNVEIRPLVIETPAEITEHDVVFDEIQDTVIQGIRDAKFIIWAAVAWFSNEAIYQELLAKKKAGLSVRIIMSDETSNQNMIQKLKAERFDVVIIPKRGYNNWNRMHEKFCIIDMDYVMHGSYNWTPTANNNDETLATALDHEYVSKFAIEFMRLYNLNNFEQLL
jgi:phosphatidylserine/phosphatidylglycerophosphate/cardiolipin synthase-like enzyme